MLREAEMACYPPTSRKHCSDGSKEKIIHLDKYGKIKNTFLTGLSLLHPIVYEDTLYVATLTNGIKAYDLLTKKEIWQTSLNKNNINSRVWSGFSFDSESKTLFVVTSNPAYDHKALVGKKHNKFPFKFNRNFTF